MQPHVGIGVFDLTASPAGLPEPSPGETARAPLPRNTARKEMASIRVGRPAGDWMLARSVTAGSDDGKGAFPEAGTRLFDLRRPAQRLEQCPVPTPISKPRPDGGSNCSRANCSER
jgi:hypothetical protein